MSAEQAEIEIRNSEGGVLRTEGLAAVFVERQVNVGLLHEGVRWERANARLGTHASRTRAEVSGGGRKPYRQKGTGNARAGSNTSPLWIGGGVAHGPKPRSYSFRMNRRQRRLALVQAVAARYRENRLILLDRFELSEPKTKEAAALLNALGVPAGRSVLIVVPGTEKAVERSFRNIAGASVTTPEAVSTADVLGSEWIVASEGTFRALEARLDARQDRA